LLKNKYIWLLGAVFFCFTFNTLGIVNTYFNTFLEINGFKNTVASNITSIITAIGIIAAPLAGFIFDKLQRQNKRFLIVAIMLMALISVAFMWHSGGKGNALTGAIMTSYSWFAIIIFIVLQGVGGGFGGGGIRPLAPMVMAQTVMGTTMGMAVLQFMQNLGTGLGSAIYGTLIDVTDPSTWIVPGIAIQVPICVLAIIIALFINPWKKN
jgi:predicted outer membrane repeat protein